ncbi:A24 family peptidase [Enterobacter asburiae]|uniref:prepilin peptidase n=1 Tax=Scandinavium sp. UTDF21-P1B TaxID=3446379 RepID=UPI00348730BE
MFISNLLFLLLYSVTLIALAWQDYKTGLLPDRLTCPLLWCGLLFYVVVLPEQLGVAVIGAMAGYCSLSLVYWIYRGIRRKEGLGYGDVKFLAALGAWLGWPQLPLLITLAAGMALTFVGFQLLAQRSCYVLKNPLRFGPFLSAAGLLLGWQTWVTLPL